MSGARLQANPNFLDRKFKTFQAFDKHPDDIDRFNRLNSEYLSSTISSVCSIS